MANNSSFDFNPNTLQRQLFEYVALWVTITDLIYFAVIYLYIPNPWPALGCALLFPALNVPALHISRKVHKPLIFYTLSFTLVPMFFVTYLAGPGGPGWIMCFSAITATHIMVQHTWLKRTLNIAFIATALGGSWLAGWSLSGVGILFAVLFGYALIVTRIFSFMVRQNETLDSEVAERLDAEKNLRKALDLINSSIHYASRIQQAFLPDKKILDEALPDNFVVWKKWV